MVGCRIVRQPFFATFLYTADVPEGLRKVCRIPVGLLIDVFSHQISPGLQNSSCR